MKEIIDVIRQQLILTLSLTKTFEEQNEALKKGDPVGVTKNSRAVEPVITKLGLLDNRMLQLLNDDKLDVAQWLAMQPESPEKEVAQKLLKKLTEQLNWLKKETIINHELLRREIQHVNYNVNVMTQTSAGVTYGTSHDCDGKPAQGTKMFDANI